MWILIISLIALVCIALLAGYIRNQRLQKKIERGELDAMPEVKEADAECCGQHEICERDSLLAAVSKKIEYYDDEELDKYIGIAPEDYTPEQEDEFQGRILYDAGHRRCRMGTQFATTWNSSAKQYQR